MDPKVIKFIRRSCGITQERLGETLGYTGSMVSYIELGKKPMSEDAIKRFRNEFGSDYVDQCRAFLNDK